jgi:DNA-binding CsgD family transcriptional regulator
MGRRSKDFKITKEELEDLYLVQKKSQKEIGEILGCTRHTIASYLKNMRLNAVQ